MYSATHGNSRSDNKPVPLDCTDYPRETVKLFTDGIYGIPLDFGSETLGVNALVQLIQFLHGDGHGDIYECHAQMLTELTQILVLKLPSLPTHRKVDLMLSLARISTEAILDIVNILVQEVTMEEYHLESIKILSDTDNFANLASDDVFIGEGRPLLPLIWRYVKNKYRTATAEFFLREFNEINITIQDYYKQKANEALYDFDSHTFTSCGKMGPIGPSRMECLGNYHVWYERLAWLQEEEFFRVDEGVQIWTVPQKAVYRIRVCGAGHRGEKTPKGAIVTTEATLEKGEKVLLVVGQSGDHTYAGCGGSFVVRHSDKRPIAVAGGAGGFVKYNEFANASVDCYGNGVPQIVDLDASNEPGRNMNIGSGGKSGAEKAGGGAGFEQNGEWFNRSIAKSFHGGSRGGEISGVSGGFGGGGAAKWCAGGGGYTGGNAGGEATFGGGGGSFALRPSDNIGLASFADGKIEITKVQTVDAKVIWEQ